MEDLDLTEELELAKPLFNQIASTLGEDRAEEFIAILIDLLKGASYEMRGNKLKLRSMELILNDYFHAKHEADGESLFQVVKDHKKLKAFELITNKLCDIELYEDHYEDHNGVHQDYYCALIGAKGYTGQSGIKLQKDEFDLLKEML